MDDNPGAGRLGVDESQSGGRFSLFGDRKIEVSPGDGPEIRVDAYSLFGDLQVSDRPSV